VLCQADCTYRNPLLDIDEGLLVEEQILESRKWTLCIDGSASLEHIAIALEVVARRTWSQFEPRDILHLVNFGSATTRLGCIALLTGHLAHLVSLGTLPPGTSLRSKEAFLTVVLLTNRSSASTSPAHLRAHIALGFVWLGRR